uniref:Translation initiation factor 5A C-terminal domain-containing protein n=1 Tax=Branchiostoma floridae TaxID=7739 RepID=C3Y730_BRAFL|eukprot:XP_002608130.1 hypothetical protein BRAFLDRAFT_91391 [Branchiostoma floridae]
MVRTPHILTSPTHLTIWVTPGVNLGDDRKAISYYEQSLQMRRSIYGEDTAHPAIAASLNNLGNAWSNLGDHRKAVSYFEQSLQMKGRIFSENTAHPDIAASLNNLGDAWRDLGDHRKAISYYEQSLQMQQCIYGEDTAHPDIATSLNNLGDAWGNLGDHRKAAGYNEQSLQMRRGIYGEDTAHPDIAASLNNFGRALEGVGDHKKAVSYYEQSLQMNRSIYGKGTSHPDITASLNNLGIVWSNLGDHRKAINYHEQSLQMKRDIYGENTAHPEIVKSLNNLCVACRDLGDYEKASYYLQLEEQLKQASRLRQNDYVMLKGRPCKIVEISSVAEEKHGHSKVMGVSDGVLETMDDEGRLRRDWKLPEGDLGKEIQTRVDRGDSYLQSIQGQRHCGCKKALNDTAMLRVCKKLREADAKGRRYGLARAETGYLRALVDAMADMDRLAEVELLKSLGDVNLEKGRLGKDVGKFNRALTLYMAALVRYDNQDQEEGQHSKEAEPLHKLGKVYLKRGIQSKDGGDFTKAAALCNAALVRSSREDIEQAIQEITQAFVKVVLEIEQKVDNDDTEKHKLMLKANRDNAQKEIKRIEQEVDPYSLDDEDPKIKEVEMKRVEEIKALCQTLVHQRKAFIAGLVDECMEVMGPPPCKYAMIGLGSQATGLVTPYSDMEFAILVEEETEPNVSFFRNLTHYLHLKVINLGETILPAMGIRSLNNFYSDNPLDSWFYDSVTPRGFAFDGAMPHACKTPFGRGRKSKLIRTPCNMTNVLKEDLTLHLKKGYHLASILGNVSFITGDQDLVDEYRSLWTQQFQDNNSRVPLNMAISLLGDNVSTFQTQALTDELRNVKKEMYRFSSLAVSFWALLYNIQPTTIWETIQELRNSGVVSSENAHHLSVLVSISAELRLRTYMNNGGQVENMSVLWSMYTDTGIEDKLQKVFYISNTKQLMRYYYTERPLKHFISQLTDPQPVKITSIFFDNSPELKAEVYKSICDFENLKTCSEQTLHYYLSKYGENTAHSDVAASLDNLAFALGALGDHKNSVRYYEQSLQMRQSIYSEDTAHPDIASSLNNLGRVWTDQGDYRKTVSYYEQSLQMMRSIYGEDTAHLNIAISLNNLGGVWRQLGDNRKAVKYFEQSLQMKRSIYGEDTAHRDMAGTLDNLGGACSSLGDLKKAVNYYKQSLLMKWRIYGENTAHADIADSLNSLGTVWDELGNLEKAISYYTHSLKINRNDLLYHRKAISYYKESLRMRRSIYGEDTAHPDIAASLDNLGCAWSDIGDHIKAVGYKKQSLQMKRSIYGENTAHADIAASLNNLGSAWSDIGDHRMAISYYKQSLEMRKSIYGDATTHPDIAMSLNNFGKVWSDLGDHRKAVSYYEQSLQMRRSIYVENTAHPDIVQSLNNLCAAWRELGDYGKAMNYLQQMKQVIEVITTSYK